MKAKPNQYRQGDVFLYRVAKIPEDLTLIEPTDSGLVLAEGESTGHAHVLTNFSHAGRDFVGDIFVEVAMESNLVHQEHDTIAVPAGIYRVRIQREYEPKAVRKVRD